MATQVKTQTTKDLRYVWGELPLLGSLPALMGDRLALLCTWTREYDEACGFHLGRLPVTLFLKSEHVQSVLVEHANHFSKGKLMSNAFDGNGIFVTEGEFHRKQRKLMSPTLHPRHIVSYADTMTHYAEQLQQQWGEGAVIDLNKEMAAVTMCIVGKTLFNTEISAETDVLIKALSIAFEYTASRMISPLHLPLNWPTPSNLRIQQALRLLEGRLQRLINERRQTCKIEGNDLLSVLLNARDEDGNPISDRQLMDDCQALFNAGHAATAATMSWTWCLLCQHPAIYQRVQQEVDRVLQGRSPTSADLEQLPYCLQVLKETMRLYPPAVAMLREALQDVEIDGYVVLKGRTVLISPYTLHHKPSYFPDPERFDPERFTPEREKQLPRYAYIPFGAGHRVCIGNHFSLMESHLLLAVLAQRVTFELLPGQAITYNMNKSFILRPYGKVEAIVRRRQGLSL